MKKLFALFILLTLFTEVYAKGNKQKEDKPMKVKMEKLDKPPYFEKDPFAIIKYIEEEFKEPQGVIRKTYPEHVIFKFILGSNGKLRDIKVMYSDKGTDPLLLQEIIRILENTPPWSPAVYKGENIAMYYTLNIDIPFVKVEAKFPEGQDSLNSFLRKELGYISNKTAPTDTAICSFTITEEGDVKDVEIKKGINVQLDNRVIEALRKMPKWIPAKSNGIDSRSKYTLPVVIQLPIDLGITEDNNVPQYVGGLESLHQFISRNIKYPIVALEEEESGIVRLKLMITKDGDIDGIEILSKVHPALNREAISVVKKMPKWIPAQKDGQPIDSSFILPISFRL